MRYLFFDIECANCFGGKGKICSFGYCIVDKDFNEIERKDIIINPKSKFHLGPAHDAVIQLAYSEEDFLKAPDFSYFYDQIKALLTKEDQIVFGHAVYNDLSFIRSDCLRYKKDLFDIKAFDTQAIYKQISEEGNDVGLERLCEKYNIEKEHLHRSDYDALITMKALKAMCYEKKVTIDEMLEAHPKAYVELKNGEILKQFNPPTNSKILLEYSKKIHVDRTLIITDICTKTFGFDDDLENNNMKLAKQLVIALRKRGGQFSIRPKKFNYYIKTNNESQRSKKVDELIKNGGKSNIITINQLLKMLNIKENELEK